ncbi:MAG: hypothetical protein Q7S33_04230 [Nanoarchaeota archaeon]|nr:hypothetical protein [Nanoarchaeota archaeon]
MKKFTILIWVGIILLVLLIWGLVGSSQAAEIGTNCDIGIDSDGSALCWTWHQNIIGDIGDSINQVLGK